MTLATNEHDGTARPPQEPGSSPQENVTMISLAKIVSHAFHARQKEAKHPLAQRLTEAFTWSMPDQREWQTDVYLAQSAIEKCDHPTALKVLEHLDSMASTWLQRASEVAYLEQAPPDAHGTGLSPSTFDHNIEAQKPKMHRALYNLDALAVAHDQASTAALNYMRLKAMIEAPIVTAH